MISFYNIFRRVEYKRSAVDVDSFAGEDEEENSWPCSKTSDLQENSCFSWLTDYIFKKRLSLHNVKNPVLGFYTYYFEFLELNEDIQ